MSPFQIYTSSTHAHSSARTSSCTGPPGAARLNDTWDQYKFMAKCGLLPRASIDGSSPCEDLVLVQRVALCVFDVCGSLLLVQHVNRDRTFLQ
jgi:hypothetical protein